MCYGNSALNVPPHRLFRFRIYHDGQKPNQNDLTLLCSMIRSYIRRDKVIVPRARSESETIRKLEEGRGGL